MAHQRGAALRTPWWWSALPIGEAARVAFLSLRHLLLVRKTVSHPTSAEPSQLLAVKDGKTPGNAVRHDEFLSHIKLHI